MIRYLWLNFLGILSGRMPVRLYDDDGTSMCTLTYRRHGRLMARRYPLTSVRNVELGPDGKVLYGSYVRRWEFMRPKASS